MRVGGDVPQEAGDLRQAVLRRHPRRECQPRAEVRRQVQEVRAHLLDQNQLHFLWIVVLGFSVKLKLHAVWSWCYVLLVLVL